jgi:hypothetical protein
MLSRRADVLVQVVAGLIILSFVYLGVERLLLSKFNVQLNHNVAVSQLNQCRLQLSKVTKK